MISNGLLDRDEPTTLEIDTDSFADFKGNQSKLSIKKLKDDDGDKRDGDDYDKDFEFRFLRKLSRQTAEFWAFLGMRIG